MDDKKVKRMSTLIVLLLIGGGISGIILGIAESSAFWSFCGILLMGFSGFLISSMRKAKIQKETQNNPEATSTPKVSKLSSRAKIIIAAAVLIIIYAFSSLISGDTGSSSSSRSHSSSSNKNSGGFVGSDGKYHAYVPEFGDDVNNWMAENW